MSIYWPITVMIAAAIVMTAFLGTKNVGWRVACARCNPDRGARYLVPFAGINKNPAQRGD